MKVKLKEAKIESFAGKILQDHYAGYSWLVEADIPNGILTVKNMNLNGDYGFVIHLKELMTDTGGHLVVQAGGELLERCGLPATIRPEDITGIQRDVRGEAKGDRYMTGGEH